MTTLDTDWTPQYSPWRHGGWYVDNIRYPSGAVGCVSRNYQDRKWRIACDDRPGSYPGGSDDHTYPSRDAAALAERELALAACRAIDQPEPEPGSDSQPDRMVHQDMGVWRVLEETSPTHWSTLATYATQAEAHAFVDGIGYTGAQATDIARRTYAAALATTKENTHG